MLVEDNRMDAIIFSRLLGNVAEDCMISTFHDGEKAISFLKEIVSNPYGSLPDLIISDLYMPKLSGYELVNYLKNDKKLRQIPVVVLSSSRSGYDINMAYKLNASCYMVKPLQLNEYKQLITDMWNFWSRVARPGF